MQPDSLSIAFLPPVRIADLGECSTANRLGDVCHGNHAAAYLHTRALPRVVALALRTTQRRDP
jgi:hypothetical protein